jgi:hypothetical protein
MPAQNPLYPGSFFPNAVDSITNQPDREIPDAIQAIEASLLGVAGAPALPVPAGVMPTSGGTFTGPLTLNSSLTLGGGTTPFPKLWGGTGVPAAGLGANGDYFLRADGGATAHLYFKSAGAWAGIV